MTNTQNDPNKDLKRPDLSNSRDYLEYRNKLFARSGIPTKEYDPKDIDNKEPEAWNITFLHPPKSRQKPSDEHGLPH